METVHPAFSTSDMDVKRRRHTTLKRLDFVRAYTEYYWSKANTIASMVRPRLFSLQAERPVPSSLQAERHAHVSAAKRTTLSGCPVERILAWRSLAPHYRQPHPRQSTGRFILWLLSFSVTFHLGIALNILRRCCAGAATVDGTFCEDSMLAQVYSGSRAFVPSALHSSVRVVENKVSELGSPLITAVQTRSEQVLTSLDRKVSPPPKYAACTCCY